VEEVNWEEINEIIQSGSLFVFPYRNNWEGNKRWLSSKGYTENDLSRCGKIEFIFNEKYDPYQISDPDTTIANDLKSKFPQLTEESIKRIIGLWFIWMR
jgi:hypothetical protein